ncbi:MAG: hypothetical protein L3J43_07540, partial [Sulfurovum sp.]|nr:hypothetical protein [Sulfurovum sp.]
ILWRKDTGKTVIWYMNADGTYTYKAISTLSTDWTLHAIGDVDKDGNADILWRKGSSNYLWYMKADGTHTDKKISGKNSGFVVVGSESSTTDTQAPITINKGDLYVIAGDSTRDGSYGQDQIIREVGLKNFDLDYIHFAQSGIQSPAWIRDQYPKFKDLSTEIKGEEGSKTVMEYSLGINDWNYLPRSEWSTVEERKAGVKERIKTAINTIREEYPKIKMFLVAPALHNLEASENLEAIYTELSEELNIPMMLNPMRDIYKDTTKELVYSKDGIHPNFLGARVTLFGIMQYLFPNLPKEELKEKLELNNSLYTAVPDDMIGNNIAQGISIENRVRIFDGFYQNGDMFRGMKIAVLGGTILKLKNYGNMKYVKLMTEKNGMDEAYINGFYAIAYNKVSTIASTVGIIVKRDDTNPNTIDIGAYDYIYIPKGVTHIYINLSMTGDDGLDEEEVEAYYATEDEMQYFPEVDTLGL